MSQNQSTSNQKRPAPAQSKQAPAQNRPAQKPQKPAQNHKNSAPAPQKAPKTQAFDAVNNKHKGHKSPKSRKTLVIAIFVVIILILATLLTLIIGNILNKIKNPSTEEPNVTYVEKTADDIKIGDLLLINGKSPYTFPNDFTDMIDVYTYQRNEQFKGETHFNDYYSYSLTFDNILIKKNALSALNNMIKDYCATLPTSDMNSNSASDIEIAWGGYNAGNLDEYASDIAKNKDFYDHALGTTFTIKSNKTHSPITEEMLKEDYAWLYNSACSYGFIIRYPNNCQEHSGFNSNGRLHLRYIGVPHATYIFENKICLEEYIDLLSESHGVNNPLSITANGKSYQVYYVKYDGTPTQIPVPKDSSYTISGDNMNGFIVTVEK